MKYLTFKQQTILHEDNGILEKTLPRKNLKLNEDAIYIVKSIEKTGCYNDALKIIIDHFADSKMTKEEIENIFKGFITFLSDEGFLNIHNEFGDTNFRLITKPHITRFFIELLNGCNLTCSHCYAAHDQKKQNILDPKRLLSHIQEALDYGVYKIDLTGGEVFTYPHIRKIITYLTSSNTFINLYSNLTLLKHDDVSFLKDQAISSVVTSIDSLTPNIHDIFRGQKGAWETTINNIRLLVTNDIPTRVNIVANENNFPEIKELCDFLYNKLGVSSVVVGTLFDIGRQIKSQIKVVPYRKLAELLAEINIQIYNRDLSVWTQKNDPSSNLSTPKCGVGQDMLFLSSWGEYAYCPILTSRENDQFILGDFYKETFGNVADRFLHDHFSPSCSGYSTCQFYSLCRGGCRARAYLNHGGLDNIDLTRCSFFENLKAQTEQQ